LALDERGSGIALAQQLGYCQKHCRRSGRALTQSEKHLVGVRISSCTPCFARFRECRRTSCEVNLSPQWEQAEAPKPQKKDAEHSYCDGAEWSGLVRTSLDGSIAHGMRIRLKSSRYRRTGIEEREEQTVPQTEFSRIPTPFS
jgi:hypothetical protein